MAGIFSSLFQGKNKPKFDLGLLGTDIHSHLIPGIDDGSQDLKMSLEMIRGLAGLGYRKLVTTPHIMADGFPNNPEIILAGLEKLRKAVAEANLTIELEAAAEYYLDEVFSENLESAELMTFGAEQKYLLFETSYISRPLSLNDMVFELLTLGYKPVMAHPERYQYHWTGDGLEEIRELRNRGILMQVNFGSFAGRQGRKAASLAREMAREGLIDFVGSDLHRPRQVETVWKALTENKVLRQLVESGSLLNSKL
jgi:tyrosine-protein phosphatase YwqE